MLMNHFPSKGGGGERLREQEGAGGAAVVSIRKVGSSCLYLGPVSLITFS